MGMVDCAGSAVLEGEPVEIGTYHQSRYSTVQNPDKQALYSGYTTTPRCGPQTTLSSAPQLPNIRHHLPNLYLTTYLPTHLITYN